MYKYINILKDFEYFFLFHRSPPRPFSNGSELEIM